MNCIYCGGEVHPRRIEILKSKGQSISCIGCAEGKVQRVVGFQVNDGKTDRSIEVCTPAQAKRLQSLERKTGQATGGPGVGKNAGKVVYKK
jgi:hypothetical protein